jgi:hypothetical protein
MNKPFTFILKVAFAALAIPLALMVLPSREAQAALFENYQTGDGSSDAIDSSIWLAQTFTASANHSVKYVRLYLTRETSLAAGTITVSVKATDLSGNPTGSDLTSASEAVTTVSYTSGWYTIYLPTCALISGTRYAIVVRASNAVSGSEIWWSGDPIVKGYADGEAVVSSNGGSSWQKANNDYLFEVYGDATASMVQTSAPTANSYPGFDDWFLPEFAYTNGDGAARAAKNVVHNYHNFNFSIPAGSTISGIEVRLDAWYNTSGWPPGGIGSFRVWLSWDHGTSKTSFVNSATVSENEATYYVGGPTSPWGRTWSPSDFTNASFEIQLMAYTNISVVNYPNQTLSLDYCQVTVYYTAPPASLPTVTTAAVSGVTSTSAASGGNVTADGGATITARGVCWSTSANPTTADSCSSDGTGSGSFTSSISGLTQATTYHVRAYATNSVGTAYGEDLTFTTNAILSVTIQGDGSGRVQSTAPDINCGSGACTMDYPYGAAINLTYSLGLRSLFGGWSGECTGITSPCAVTMDRGREVIAAFGIDPDYAVWIDPGTNYFNTIGAAYQAAGSSAHIKACRLSFSEPLLFGDAKTITLTGGYNSAYSDKNALTTVTGSLTVGSGSLTVENLAIR